MNNENARNTSFLTPAQWDSLIGTAFYGTCVLGPAALLIAFDHTARYDNDNFRWFAKRFSSFVYIDRVVVGADHRKRGLANLLYLDLFDTAAKASHDIVVCEVNEVPPNPGSDAFHAKMGFSHVGSAELSGGKHVRYLKKSLV